MLGRTFLFAFILISLAAVVSAKPPGLDISVEPAGLVYRVSITFTGEADGTTNIRLPNEWGGQEELYKAIRNVSVSKGATLADTDKPFVKTLTHQPGKRITVTYEIVQDFQGPLTNAIRYRPVTDAQYIHWIGN